MTLPWPAHVLRSGDSEEVAIETPDGRVRLSVKSGSVLNGTVHLTYMLDGDRLGDRLKALQRWHYLVQTGKALPPKIPPSGRTARWPLLIATLDALADQCSLREIATRLFGGTIVARDWNAGSDYLKLRTRRLVTQARALAMGGYRSLL